MGEIAESGKFPIQKFRSNSILGFGATRDNSTAQRTFGARKYDEQFNEWNQ